MRVAHSISSILLTSYSSSSHQTPWASRRISSTKKVTFAKKTGKQRLTDMVSLLPTSLTVVAVPQHVVLSRYVATPRRQPSPNQSIDWTLDPRLGVCTPLWRRASWHCASLWRPEAWQKDTGMLAILSDSKTSSQGYRETRQKTGSTEVVIEVRILEGSTGLGRLQ